MFQFTPGDIFADNYQLVRQVDVGGFAEVWEALFLGKRVALKIFPKLDAEGIARIENEYKEQADLLHTNLLIPRYYGITQGQPFLEMRFCNGGNAAKKVGQYSEKEIAKCLYQISSALSYLHAQEIVHQDIRPNNFLLDSDGTYYLADLGLSMKLRQTIKRFTQSQHSNDDTVARKTSGLTPPCYRATELYERPGKQRPPLIETDIWSLGASIFEMADGDLPFGDFGGMMQMNDPSCPDLPDVFSKELNEIIKKCLARDTSERPKASDIADWAANYLKAGFYRKPDAIDNIIPRTEPNVVPEKVVTVPKPAKARNKTPLLLIAVLVLVAVSSALIYRSFFSKPVSTPVVDTENDSFVMTPRPKPTHDTSSRTTPSPPVHSDSGQQSAKKTHEKTKNGTSETVGQGLKRDSVQIYPK